MEGFNIEDSIRGIWDKLGNWLDAAILGLPNFILAVIVFIIFIIIAKYVGSAFNKIFRKSIKQESIRQMAIKVIKAIIILIGFFFALGLLNLNTVLTSILGAAGVVGLAIGLALQGTLNNTFSGVILSFLPEIQIGDWVETNGFAGSITEINLRNIVIKQSDNNYVIIPNSKIVDEPFKNFSRTPRSRVFIHCGVGYKSDLEMVRDLTIKVLEEHFPQRGNEEVEFMYQEFGDSSINYVARFWTDVTKNRDILIAQNKAIIEIKKAYDAKGINIPFPIRTIDFTNSLSLSNKD
ncbi:mechanosensitive ion channel family protein [Gramella sp. AN32]|uniref:Mechanosensitive ion channel family protein n=1 Tax=Christiangramia antarctica TaxID=2058158 RepID=A0ABW5X1T1_9FLAO|nr:mechanosensitive ion channel family protein [Gramella sp. AN32]MCM4157135.1 mechanosensitive ion channel protein MscS [Gramella sp. AN32]